MIIIELTNNMVEGEPGPNLYIRGKPKDFLQLSMKLHFLGIRNNLEFELDTLIDNIASNVKIILKSSNNGKILTKIIDGILYIDLTPTLWQEILHDLFTLSFGKGHIYIEFDDCQLIEEVNIIASSE